jgi:hypothetical protein
MRKILLLAAAILLATFSATIPVFANSTDSHGQPGAFNGVTCASVGNTTPGNSANSPGSPFNPNGNAGLHYAGNPGTASLAHSNSPHPVSDYDIACFQQSQH